MDNKRTRLRSQAAVSKEVPISDAPLSSREALHRSGAVEVEVEGDHNRGLPVVRAANKRKRDPRGAGRRPKQKLKPPEGSVTISVGEDAKASSDEVNTTSERYESIGAGEVYSRAPIATALNTYVIIPEIMPQDQAVIKQLDRRRESSRPRIKPSKFREGFLLSTAAKSKGDQKSVADEVASSLEIVLPVDSHARAKPVDNAKASLSLTSESERSPERPSVPVVRPKLKITCKSGTARATDFWGNAAESSVSAKTGSDDNGLKAAYAVLKRVMQIKSAEPFNEPVDPVALEIPDYLKVIKQPMDLGTIREFLETGQKYRTAQDVYEDVQLVWGNCRDYNQTGDPIMDILKVVENVFNKHWNAAGLPTSTAGAKVPRLQRREESSKAVSISELVPVRDQHDGEEARRKKPKDSKVAPTVKTDNSSLRIKTKRSASVEHVMAESKAREDKLDLDNVEVTREDSNHSQEHAGDDSVEDEQVPWKVFGRGLKAAKETQTNGSGVQEVAQASNIMKESNAKQAEGPTGVFENAAKTPLEHKEKSLQGSPSNKRRTFGTVHHKPECPCVVCVGRRRKLARQEREGVEGRDDRRSKSKSLNLGAQIKSKVPKVVKFPKLSQLQETELAAEIVRPDSHMGNSFDVDALMDGVRYYPANYDLPLRKVNPSLLQISQILFANYPNTVWRRYHSLGSSTLPSMANSAMFDAIHHLTLNGKKS